jgi:hypothetical protein
MLSLCTSRRLMGRGGIVPPIINLSTTLIRQVHGFDRPTNAERAQGTL